MLKWPVLFKLSRIERQGKTDTNWRRWRRHNAWKSGGVPNCQTEKKKEGKLVKFELINPIYIRMKESWRVEELKREFKWKNYELDHSLSASQVQVCCTSLFWSGFFSLLCCLWHLAPWPHPSKICVNNGKWVCTRGGSILIQSRGSDTANKI